MSGARQQTTFGDFVPRDPSAQLSVLLREALALQASGADVINIDTLAVGRLRGPFAGVDDDTLALLVAGIVSVGVPVSVSTDLPETAGLAVEHGAGWVIDPSGGSAVRLDPRVAESDCRLVIGPWGRPLPRSPFDVPGAFAERLLRNAARLLDAGIASERICVDAGAGLGHDDPEPWRILNDLERLVALGYPVLVPATEDLLTDMVAEESTEVHRDDAAIAIAALAVGAGAWAVRTQRAGIVADMIHRMHADPSGSRARTLGAPHRIDQD